MSYATFQQHLDIRGQETVLNALKGSSVLKEQLVDDANEAASSEIDGAGEEGGYTVPFIPAELSADIVVQTRIDSWLRHKTVIIAASFFLQVLDSSEQIKAAQKWCQDALDRLRMGKGFPVPPPSNAASLPFFLVTMPGTSDRLTQETFREGRRILL